ncbi:siderophore-interacting protein [Rhodococcus spongiicola]|uniref:Siderophore-interacting protein n=1 Tax=Rhodococcus spongiicola TaxID=2487352 RepID=A0A3S3ACV2_9NOCA|nr:siderophore-interacting protein [Rhodococcus spongiicola]RVW01543.1 siderophore-interacting protein [Rhodococcus spongiicola]
MAKRSKFVKPEQREIVSAHVLGSKQISPNFVRVTIGGDGLHGFTPMGFDQWFRMFIPGPEQTGFRLPTTTGNLWYAQFKLIPKDVRPTLRNYTVREFRPEGGVFGDGPELDIDFTSHGDLGPASAWANSCATGDPVGLLDEGLIYNPTPDARWHLLVGDESALPAIAGILRSVDPTLRVRAYVEIPDSDDIAAARDVAASDNVDLQWLVRESAIARPGALALETIMASDFSDLPGGPFYTFVAGESDLATGVRRHLVADRNVPKSDIAFTGYWRHGHASN